MRTGAQNPALPPILTSPHLVPPLPRAEIRKRGPQPTRTLGQLGSALSLREFAQFDFADKDIEWCLRLSPDYYNTEEEVDHVAAAVVELVGREA
ncbi:hypothetical protein [Streptomyces griseus]|uniref:hypothetical protein n=1 Tax=Streptomyces griseus TaxID=1911 RepID=UPI003410A182